MYYAAKSGILGLMRGLRSEVVKRNVTVNVVAPWLTGAYAHSHPHHVHSSRDL
jgi:NAD(P)-dependent dehydrogenase (short-subunit alcohol dehydrogenase family)